MSKEAKLYVANSEYFCELVVYQDSTGMNELNVSFQQTEVGK